MPDLTDAIAAAHAALDERFYPGPTEEMVRTAVEAAAPIIAAKAWDEAIANLVYSDGTRVEIIANDNPYRTPKETP